MTALCLLIVVPGVMWAAQSVQLRAAGIPVRWRIDSRGGPASLRTSGRVTTYVSLVGVIVAYPLLVGEDVYGYYSKLFPRGLPAQAMIEGAAASVLCLCVLYGAWIVSGRVEVLLHQSRRKWVKRLLLLAPTALLGAGAEELLFRGVLMADLLRSGRWSGSSAVCITAAIFALAHYVRSVKRRWTFPGHLALGALLSMAFLRTGDLWLATGLHAGGIFVIMGTRPFFRFRGPAWLTGASIFPFAGVVGIAGLGVLMMYVSRYEVVR